MNKKKIGNVSRRSDELFKSLRNEFKDLHEIEVLVIKFDLK